MLQLITDVFRNKDDTTELALLFANQTEDDILLRDDLERIQKENPNRFKLWFTVDRPKEGWKYSTGFIDEGMIRDRLFQPGPDSLVLMCGPPPMIQFACVPNLEKIGFNEDSRFSF